MINLKNRYFVDTIFDHFYGLYLNLSSKYKCLNLNEIFFQMSDFT